MATLSPTRRSVAANATPWITHSMVFQRRSWAIHLVGGLLVGAGLGVTGRVFMRLISEDPDFTWSGTLQIMVVFTVFGLVQGVVSGTRSRTSKRWITVPTRLIGGLSYLSLGGGAGVAMIPFLWCGATAVWCTNWPRLLRVGAGFVAVANLVALAILTFTELEVSPRVVFGVVVLTFTYGGLVMTAGPTLAAGSLVSSIRSRKVL